MSLTSTLQKIPYQMHGVIQWDCQFGDNDMHMMLVELHAFCLCCHRLCASRAVTTASLWSDSLGAEGSEAGSCSWAR